MTNLKNFNLLASAAGASLLMAMIANADDSCSLSAVADKTAAEAYVNEIATDLVKESESNDKDVKKILKVMRWNPLNQYNNIQNQQNQNNNDGVNYVQSENPNLDLFLSAQQTFQNTPGSPMQQIFMQQQQVPQVQSPNFRQLNMGVGLIERMQQRMQDFYQNLPNEMNAAIQSQQQIMQQSQQQFLQPQALQAMAKNTRSAMALRWANSDPRFRNYPQDGLHNPKLNFDAIKNQITLAANEALGGCHDTPLNADELRRANLPPVELQMEDARLSQPVSSDFALICNGGKRVTFLIWDTAFAAPNQTSPLGTGASLTVSTASEAENDSPLKDIDSAPSTKTTMFSGQGHTFRNIAARNNGNTIANNKVVMEKTSGESESTSDVSGPLDSYKRNQNPDQRKLQKALQNRIFEIKGYDGSTPVQQRLGYENQLTQGKQAAANALASVMKKARACDGSSIGQDSDSSSSNSRWKRKASSEALLKDLKIEISTPVENKNSNAKAL
jgi:hypothetical protein